MLHHLGLTCREAREAAGLRQIEIAVSAGTSHATISRLETGRAWPMHPDVVVAAYAAEAGTEPLALWAEAVQRWHATAAESPS
jgi:transcriptional regulator with XRE-family HTH domain